MSFIEELRQVWACEEVVNKNGPFERLNRIDITKPSKQLMSNLLTPNQETNHRPQRPLLSAYYRCIRVLVLTVCFDCFECVFVDKFPLVEGLDPR